ncbi:hypothetical protein LKMONMHP_4599 [Methylobacterium organophilum]|uniref:Glycosyltransferase 61 catalytic domain-containing protein n=1 Tax=Methylobacterium organophilum TaxID=410 RepID=A0ABQ4TDF9_METOR|nr:hypothetical protein LKMONMHP_4599 [Methylobacterium organophilum]
MSSLQPCTSLWGTTQVIEDAPTTKIFKNCIYLPYAHGKPWGIIDADGKFISESIDYREGLYPPPDQVISTEAQLYEIPHHRENTTYIYGGRINPHFGHFLINTLPRYWNVTKIRSPNTKILYHGPNSSEELFSIPFVSTIFRQLGLAPRDFINFQQNTKISNIVIPSTSFEEQRAGYLPYRNLCSSIGDRILYKFGDNAEISTIYYSKTRLKSAVGNISNEIEIENYLHSNGVQIFYPEMLSFEEQIYLMSNCKNIIASSGSFLHASIFCPPRKITCLNVTEKINTNYTIIDQLTGNDAAYYYPSAIQVLPKTEGFLTSRYIPDAEQVAAEILELSRM